MILERHFKPDYLGNECGRSCLFIGMTRELVALPLAQCETHLSGPKLNRFFRTAKPRRDLESGKVVSGKSHQLRQLLWCPIHALILKFHMLAERMKAAFGYTELGHRQSATLADIDDSGWLGFTCRSPRSAFDKG